jgi:hypothetical protein
MSSEYRARTFTTVLPEGNGPVERSSESIKRCCKTTQRTTKRNVTIRLKSQPIAACQDVDFSLIERPLQLANPSPDPASRKHGTRLMRIAYSSCGGLTARAWREAVLNYDRSHHSKPERSRFIATI